MPPFRLVEGEEAGPHALGVLVPPGARTLVILRPRSLAWDLLLLRGYTPQAPVISFWEVARAQAPALADQVRRAIESSASADGVHVFPVTVPDGLAHRVLARIGPYHLILCPREPGRPYRPLDFANEADARDAIGRIALLLTPGANANQELYLNTRHFARSGG